MLVHRSTLSRAGKEGVYDAIISMQGYPYINPKMEADYNATASDIMSSNLVVVDMYALTLHDIGMWPVQALICLDPCACTDVTTVPTQTKSWSHIRIMAFRLSTIVETGTPLLQLASVLLHVTNNWVCRTSCRILRGWISRTDLQLAMGKFRRQSLHGLVVYTVIFAICRTR